MSSNIEPLEVRIGDTWAWSRSLSAYPASVWTLTYTLLFQGSKITITAVADGENHRVNVPASTTAGYSAGRYEWVANVSDGVERHSVGGGQMELLHDLAAVSFLDTRSHARQMLDALEAALQNRATDGDLDILRVRLPDIDTERDAELMSRMRNQYAAMVEAEDNAELAKRGGKPNWVQQRF